MKKRACSLFAAALLLCGCSVPTGSAGTSPAFSMASPVPAVAVTAAPAPSPADTPEPSPSPAPSPAITDAWYTARCEQMRKYIRLYGDPAWDDAAANAYLRSMEIDPDKPMIALTFDDGPVLGVTDRILDLLEQYQARATFFVCGWRLQKEGAGALLQRMAAMGCEIGNHTYSHSNLQNLSIRYKKDACLKNTEAIQSFVEDYPVLSMRPPGGTSGRIVRKTLKDLGYAIILWSQSANVNLITPRKIADNVQKQAVNGRELQSGDIVLLHDTKEHMVEAVALLLPELIAQGYQLVTVQELLHLSETGFRPGVEYRSQTDWYEQ